MSERKQPPFVWVAHHYDGQRDLGGPYMSGVALTLEEIQKFCDEKADRNRYLATLINEKWRPGGYGLWGTCEWRRGQGDGSGPWQSVSINYLEGEESE